MYPIIGFSNVEALFLCGGYVSLLYLLCLPSILSPILKIHISCVNSVRTDIDACVEFCEQNKTKGMYIHIESMVIEASGTIITPKEHAWGVFQKIALVRYKKTESSFLFHSLPTSNDLIIFQRCFNPFFYPSLHHLVQGRGEI